MTTHLSSWLLVYYIFSSWLWLSSVLLLSVIISVLPLPNPENNHKWHDYDYYPTNEEQLPWLLDQNTNQMETIMLTTWLLALYLWQKNQQSNPTNNSTTPANNLHLAMQQHQQWHHHYIHTQLSWHHTPSTTWQHQALMLLLITNNNHSPNMSLALVTNKNTWIPWNYVYFVPVNSDNKQTFSLLLFLPVTNKNSPTMLLIMTLTPTKWMPQPLSLFPLTNVDVDPKMAQHLTMATQPMTQQPHLSLPSTTSTYRL